METNSSIAGKQKESASLIGNVWKVISSWFKPEEVEVTFKEDISGHITSYSYTVVDQHKQVA